jgi:hypothetical protein
MVICLVDCIWFPFFFVSVCPPFEQKNRDVAGRFLLLLPIRRKHGDRFRKGLLALIPPKPSRGRSKRLIPDLNHDIGMSQQVVVPRWVFWGTFESIS